MTNRVFIDCEWVSSEDIIILGAYCPRQLRFQLYDERITWGRFIRFLNKCSKGEPENTYLFSHGGVDIGLIESHFDVDLRGKYHCINTCTAFKRFARFKTASLYHLEEYFGLKRIHYLNHYEIDALWNSGLRDKRQRVLDYNWEDCMNLWRLVNILRSDYGVTNRDFKNIRMR